MGTAFGTLNGGLTIRRNEKIAGTTDCYKCKRAYITPAGTRTVVTGDNGITFIQNGKGVFCMDDSSDKNITMSEDGMICSKFEPKE